MTKILIQITVDSSSRGEFPDNTVSYVEHDGTLKDYLLNVAEHDKSEFSKKEFNMSGFGFHPDSSEELGYYEIGEEHVAMYTIVKPKLEDVALQAKFLSEADRKKLKDSI